MTAQVRAISEARFPENFTLGSHRVDLGANTVSLGNHETRLTPKAAGVLGYLAQRAGKAVPREELLDHVWADAFPTDDVLSHAIAELRRALGDDARNSRIIETIPKVGYRLLLEPTFGGDTAQDPVSTPRSGRWLGIAAAFVAGLGAGALGFHLSRQPLEPPPPLPEDPLKRSFPVTAGPGPESMPAVSADGRQVAFVASEGPGSATDIQIKNLSGDVVRPLTQTPDAFEYSPVWSPDGAEIAFLRFEQGKCHIVLKPVGGGLERQLGSCPGGAITYIDWSPDGSRLALSDLHGDTPVTSIILLGLEDGVRTPLSYQLSGEHDVQPKFSPDGRWIAFRRGVNPRSELYVVPAEGGDVRQLTDFGSRFYGFDWLPDSEHIWFCAHREGQPALWEVSIRQATVGAVSGTCPFGMSLASTEAVMAYEDHGGDSNLIEITTTDGVVAEQPLFTSTRDERDASYSPDSRQVVFISDRSGEDQLWLGNRDSGQAFQLTRLSGLSLGTPRFFADGRHVLFLGAGGGVESLYRVSVRSGVVERLSHPGERVRAAAPVPDGTVLMTSDRSGDWQIWQLEPDTLRAVRMTDNGGHRAVAPGDGNFYYTKLDRYKLWRRSLDGGPEVLVSHEVHFANHELWQVHDRRLIVPQWTREETLQVVSLPLRPKFDADEQVVLLDFSVDRAPKLSDLSSDGERILISDMQDMRADILAVSGFQLGPRRN